MRRLPRVSIGLFALAFIAIAASMPVQAGCGCPSDRNGAPSTEAGELPPPETGGQSTLPGWKLVEFVREGIGHVAAQFRLLVLKAY